MITLQDVVKFIFDADDETLATLEQSVRDARRIARSRRQSQAVAEFKSGDRVALSGLSPQYVNGATGTIIERRNTKFLVQLDPDVDPRVTARFGQQVRVPATALTKVEVVIELEEGDPCPSCDEPMEWDPGERMLFCPNDWEHG